MTQSIAQTQVQTGVFMVPLSEVLSCADILQLESCGTCSQCDRALIEVILEWYDMFFSLFLCVCVWWVDRGLFRTSHVISH